MASNRQTIARVEPNLLDKAIIILAPQWGGERLRARTQLAMYGSYTGARSDRRQTQNWFPSRGDANADTLTDLISLRTRSRDMVRNNPFGGGAINTVVQNAVGTGLALQPTPDLSILGWSEAQGTEWASQVEHEFAMWAESKDCDVTRTDNFYGLQVLAFRSCLESGDVFSLLPMRQVGTSPYKTAVQIIEADRVMSPYGHVDGMPAVAVSADGKPLNNGNQVWAGVEVNAYGAPEAYLVFHKHPGSSDFMAGYKDNTLFDRVEAFGKKTQRRNVIHLFDRRRPDQKRGVPYLAPVIEPLKQIDRYTEAELMRAVVSSMFTVFVKSEQDPSNGPLPAPNTAGPVPEMTLGTGMIQQLAPGEDVTFADPNSPNPNFDPFVTAILRQVGVTLELPFEVLIKHFTASYSAARAAMLEAWKFYKNRRTFVADGFCQPIFEAWMDEAVAIGRIAAPGYFKDHLLRRAYLSTIWIGDAPGQIDPGKEVDAAQKRVDGGFSTIKREAMELTGGNFEDIHRQRATEHQMRVEAGLEPMILNANATEPVMVPTDPNDPDGDGDNDMGDSAKDGEVPGTQPAPQPIKKPVKKPTKGGKK